MTVKLTVAQTQALQALLHEGAYAISSASACPITDGAGYDGGKVRYQTIRVLRAAGYLKQTSIECGRGRLIVYRITGIGREALATQQAQVEQAR